MRTGRLAQACPGWRGDLAAGLVGAPDPPACAALWHHLGTCPACQADYEGLVPVVGWHALLTSPEPRNMRRLAAGRERAEVTPGGGHFPAAEPEPPGAEPCEFFRALRQHPSSRPAARR